MFCLQNQPGQLCPEIQSSQTLQNQAQWHLTNLSDVLWKELGNRAALNKQVAKRSCSSNFCLRRDSTFGPCCSQQWTAACSNTQPCEFWCCTDQENLEVLKYDYHRKKVSSVSLLFPATMPFYFNIRAFDRSCLCCFVFSWDGDQHQWI